MTLPLQSVLEGKYEILEKIGEGGIGSVYKVRHRLLEEIRVIKVLRSQTAASDDVQQRFLHEARMAIKLKHPNIAQLYDFSVTDDDTAYIVMEYIDGVAVDAMQRSSGAPSVGMAVEISRQTLAALGYLHQHRFVHRDISPDNLMLTRDHDGAPLVKLIDLGIAKNLAEGVGLTATGMFLGKVRYSSPEQFSREGAGEVLDHRSDLYSFAVMLYELLTDQHPFVGKTFSELAGGHLFKPPRPFAETDPGGKVPTSLQRIVLKALEKKPDRRFSSASELADALAAFADSPAAIGEEWDRLYRATTESQSQTVEIREPGSTQSRLDFDFCLVTTPSPPALYEVPLETASLDPSLGLIDLEVERIDELLAAGKMDAADRALTRAVGRFGRLDVFHQLRRRLRIAQGPAARPLGKSRRVARRPRWLYPAVLVLTVAAAVIWKGEQIEQWLPAGVLDLLPTGSPAATEPALAPDPAVAETPGQALASAEETAPPAGPAAALSEQFTVTSRPSGATVYLAGEKLGQTTPAQVTLMPSAKHRLRIELEGYEPSGLEFSLEGLSAELRQSAALHFPLKSLVPPGTLIVRSTYPVTVHLPSRSPQRGSAETRLSLAPGAYDVEVRAPAVFYRGRHPIEIFSDEDTVIQLPPTTTVAVAAAPSNCQVSIDGRAVDIVPFSVDLAHGPHTLVFNWNTLGESKTIERIVTSETRRLFAATGDG